MRRLLILSGLATGLLSACALDGSTGASSMRGTQPAVDIISETHLVPAQDDPAIRLFVRNKRAAGSAPQGGERTVLFVHGATYPSESAFDIDLPGGSWLDILAARGFDAWMMDVRGYGGSSRPAAMGAPPAQNPPFADTADAVRDVAAVVDFIRQRRGISTLNLVGWSWGTSIMAGYTAAHNDAVERLVLYAPLWLIRNAPAISGTGAWRAVTADAARQRGVRGIPPERVEEISPSAWFEQRWQANLASDPEGAALTPPVVRAPNGVIKDLAGYWTIDKPWYDPAQIRVPTLLVLGEWDQDTPLYMAQELFARLENVRDKRQVILGEGTHAMALEKNRMRLIDTVNDFLALPRERD